MGRAWPIKPDHGLDGPTERIPIIPEDLSSAVSAKFLEPHGLTIVDRACFAQSDLLDKVLCGAVLFLAALRARYSDAAMI